MLLIPLADTRPYRGLSPLFAKAFDFLATADLAALPEGKNPVPGADPADLFAGVNRYDTRGPGEDIWESHRVYADIQLVLSGRELVGWTPLGPDLAVTTPYTAEKDFAFYARPAGAVFFALPPGLGAVFFPHDVHAPNLDPAPGQKARVHKIVMKVRVG